jgi:hypothetical protein
MGNSLAISVLNSTCDPRVIELKYIPFKLHWTKNSKKKKIVSVMNLLLIYLLSSMKLQNVHEKLLGCRFKLCYHHDILWKRLKYHTEWWNIEVTERYSVEKRVL